MGTTTLTRGMCDASSTAMCRAGVASSLPAAGGRPRRAARVGGVSAEPRVVSRRRRLLGAPAIALHRGALALVRRLPPPRAVTPSPGPPAVLIVLANAFAMGGTVRATFSLAAGLAEGHRVEI